MSNIGIVVPTRPSTFSVYVWIYLYIFSCFLVLFAERLQNDSRESESELNNDPKDDKTLSSWVITLSEVITMRSPHVVVCS